jgi:hypothetical protein
VPRARNAETPCASTKDWLWAHHPTEPPLELLRYTGKWLLFSPCELVASRWETIWAATRTGRLGFSAKVSTDCRVVGPRHVICVYTRDWRDLGDVRRVGRALGDVGAVQTETLWYKADEQTLAGVYAGSGPVSLYRMDPPYAELALYKGMRRFAETNREAALIVASWAQRGPP